MFSQKTTPIARRTEAFARIEVILMAFRRIDIRKRSSEIWGNWEYNVM